MFVRYILPIFVPQGESYKSSCAKKFQKNIEAKKRALIKQAMADMSKKDRISYQKSMKKYGPQASMFVPFYFQIATHLREKMSEQMMDKIEGLVSLYVALSHCVCKAQFVSIAVLYAKTHCSKSLISYISVLADDLFKEYTPQSSSPEWLSLMTTSLSNWKLVTTNPGFAKVSKVLSMMVTLGIFSKDVSCNISGVELFSVSAMERQLTAVDLIDAVVETVVFFAEGAYKCFEDGSFNPLLYSTTAIAATEKRYIEMLSLWEYARNGNLDRFASISEAEFDKQLKKLVVDLEVMYKQASVGAEKKILCDRWRDMSKILTEFESSRVRGGLRKNPWTLKVFSESSCGKSSFTDVAMATLLKSNGFPAGDDFVITLNPDDKHMSNMRSYVTGIKIDDYGNTKLDYVDLAPSDWIIQICNNIKRYAVMADLANKGKVSIEPAIVTITTNVEDLLAHQVSNEPVSIGRRANCHVEIKVKPEFCRYDELGNITHMLDPVKVFEKYGDSNEIQDLWNVTVRELQILPTGCQGKRLAPTFEFINKQGMTDVSIFQFLDFAIKESKQHFMVQDALVKQQTGLADKLPWCELCCIPSQLCSCEEDCEPQFGISLAHTISSYADKWTMNATRQTRFIASRVEDISNKNLISALRWFESSPFASWTNYVPDSWIVMPWVKALVMMLNEDVLRARVRSAVINYCIVAFVTCSFIYFFSSILASISVVICAICFLFYYATIVENVKETYYEEVKKRRDIMPEMFVQIRENHMKYVCGAIAGFSVIWGVVKTVQAFRAMTSFQGVLKPKSIAEIKQRDSEANVWLPEAIVKVGGEYPHDMSHWESAARKSLWYFSYEVDGNIKYCDAFMVRTHVLMIPFHMVPITTTTATIQHKGQVISFIMDPTRIHRMEGTDLALVYVANSGSCKNMTSFLAPTVSPKGVPCTSFFVDEAGVMHNDRFFWNPNTNVSNGLYTFKGSYYSMSQATFGGQCMSLIVSEGAQHHILGFHLGGQTGRVDGCAGSLTRPELLVGIAKLMQLSPAYMLGPESTELPDTILGKKYDVSGGVHFKSPVNWIPDDSAVVAYGEVSGRSKMTSKVMELPISEAVTAVTSMQNLWGAPKFTTPRTRADGVVINETYQPWSTSLVHCCKPSIGFPASDVDCACDDYLLDLKDCFEDQKEMWKEQMRPLTEVETVSGVDGWKFIDAMKTGTSIGFPVGGSKAPHLIYLNPDDYDNISEPKIFKESIMEEYREAIELWADRKCRNCIFGSALKDEPTLLTKDKVRVFQAAPIILQLAVRRFFLPVARFLSMNPLIAECAVGINASGREWDELANHMNKFGKDRIVAGDYSKYDLRMPAQLTQAAFSVMIRIAKWSGNYSAKDITVMESISFEVTSPLVAFNGTLLRFLGTNPSGQNMTVYINSIVNSLLNRLSFFHVYDAKTIEEDKPGFAASLGRPVRFRDCNSIAIYGDDLKGSAIEGLNRHNHVSFANFLADNDMKFTMPDKESAPIPFMNDNDADFLKRKNRFDDEMNATVGMLDEMSIFKSLHSGLKSADLSPLEVSAQNIDGALREWFFHGRDIFEERRAQMKLVADMSGVFPLTLSDDYNDRLSAWRQKYD